MAFADFAAAGAGAGLKAGAGGGGMSGCETAGLVDCAVLGAAAFGVAEAAERDGSSHMVITTIKQLSVTARATMTQVSDHENRRPLGASSNAGGAIRST